MFDAQLVVADVLKRKQEDGDEEAAKKPRLDIPIEEQMLMATIPYHSISYQEQVSPARIVILKNSLSG